jgi:glucokinase
VDRSNTIGAFMKICADAGGSKVRFAVVDEHYNVRRIAKYNVADLPQGEAGLSNALSKFAIEISSDTDLREISHLVIGAAGPVENSSVHLTNSDWRVERDALKSEFASIISGPFKVGLINDFEALAYGLALLGHDDVIALHSGKTKGDTRLVCGPGTGLGLAALRSLGPDRFDVIAIPTEGGHQSFPAETPMEREIWDYFMQPIVTYEHILSGPGLQTLYSFFSEKAGRPNAGNLLPVDIIKQFSQANPIAMRTLETFASILGAFCGNMVLALGARQGVYLWGGILKEFPEQLLRRNMLQRLHKRAKGLEFVADAPVFRIISDEVALKGCALYADKFL